MVKRFDACMRASTNGANLKLTHQNHLNCDIESKGKLLVSREREKKIGRVKLKGSYEK